ncbi:MAG: PAS domain-containing protein [Planctomycetota bacterium]
MGIADGSLDGRTEELAVINRILTAVIGSGDVAGMLPDLFCGMIELTGADAALLHVPVPGGEAFELRDQRGVAEDIARKMAAVKPGIGHIGMAAAKRRPEPIEDAARLGGRVKPFWGDETLTAGVALPLTGETRCWAVIMLGARAAGAFSEARVRVLTGVLKLAGAAADRLAGAGSGPDPVVALQSFLDIIDAVSDGVLLADDQGRVVAANRALEQMTGFGRETLLRKPLAGLVEDWLAMADAREKKQLVRQIEERKAGVARPLELTGKDGVVYHAMLDLLPARRTGLPWATMALFRKTAKPLQAGGEHLGRTRPVPHALGPFAVWDRRRRPGGCDHACLGRRAHSFRFQPRG